MSRITFVAFAVAALSLAALAQPSPATTGPGPLPTPAGTGGPTVPNSGPVRFAPPPPTLAPGLNSSLTPEEFAKYTAFQQQLNNDPAVKELNEKISVHIKEVQRLQAEARVLREKLTATNPEMHALQNKIMAMMRVPPGTGPVPLPPPAKSN